MRQKKSPYLKKALHAHQNFLNLDDMESFLFRNAPQVSQTSKTAMQYKKFAYDLIYATRKNGQDYENALATLKKRMALVEAEKGLLFYDEEIVASLIAEAIMYKSLNNPSYAELNLLRAAGYTKSLQKDEEFVHLIVLWQLSLLYEKQNDFEMHRQLSLQILEQSIHLESDRYGLLRLIRTSVLSSLVHSAHLTENWAEAIEWTRLLLTEDEEQNGKHSVEFCRRLITLARLFSWNGQRERSIHYYSRALSLLEHCTGRVETIKQDCHNGLLIHYLGIIVETIEKINWDGKSLFRCARYMQKVEEIFSTMADKNYPRHYGFLMEYAGVLDRMGKTSKADEMRSKALALIAGGLYRPTDQEE